MADFKLLRHEGTDLGVGKRVSTSQLLHTTSCVSSSALSDGWNCRIVCFLKLFLKLFQSAAAKKKKRYVIEILSAEIRNEQLQ